MKDSSCCTGSGVSTWLHPNLVRVVAWVIMITAGTIKFLGGSQVMAIVGGMALSIFGIKEGSFLHLALTLWYIAATIEILWGLSFALGCRKTSRIAALGLAIVTLIALITRLMNLETVTGTAFEVFAWVLTQIQLELLLFALFAQKALWSCCKPSCCTADKKMKK